MSTYLHIGYPKTATSWFKNYFYPYVKNASIIYNDKIIYDVGDNDKNIEIITDDTFLKKEHIFIVSHKFSGLVDFQWENGKFRDYFAPQLKKSFSNAKIILFLRNQLDFLASAYSSYLAHGGTFTFRKMHKSGLLTNGHMFAYEFLDYPKLIDQYHEHFGEENVYVFLYEEFQNAKKEFLKEYSKLLKLDIVIENLDYRKYNQKLRKGFAGFIRFANKFSSKGVQPKKHYINAPFLFSWINSKSSIKINQYKIWGTFIDNEKVLGKDLINEIQKYYKESNNKLLKYKGCNSIREYRYPL